MKRWLIVILFIIFSSSANAIGLAVAGNTNINFVPNSEHEFTYFITSAAGMPVETFLDGDLKKYTKISKIYGDIDDDMRSFSIKVSLPSKLDPGKHSVGVGVREKGNYRGKGTGLGSLTSVISPIKLFVPYKGKYIEAELYVPDGNNNETITAKIKITNLGELNLSSVYADIEIYDFNYKKIGAVETNKVELNRFDKDELSADINLNGYSYGDYNAKANIHYDEETKVLESTFRVGAYLVNLVNYTQNFYPNTFNEFKVHVKSEWNGLIDNVYSVIEVDGKTLKTTGTSLNSFETGELITYWNPGNITLGSYPINITLFYADKESKQTGYIRIIERALTFIDKLKPFIVPSLVILLILLMIFNMYLVLRLNKNKK